MNDCLFCNIIDGKIGAKIVYSDKNILAFEDIKPQAPVHLLIITKKHIERVSEARKDDAILMGELCLVAAKLAREKGIESSGYRLVINCNKDAGQIVFHLHMHLLGGRSFNWPPG
ncbi:MAG: histidine triad nucleotide-binding protein [Candidatus Omnitrophica bacterium]|nr:histidine triad nucleotide-binding protein [Candidatus Omnitrophota bacterium]